MKCKNDFPWIPLGVFPTPIQKMENISKELGTNVYIERDDLTGVGLGDNKVRKLEFLMADAIEKGAELLQADISVDIEDFSLRNMDGPGYAIPSEEGNAAIKMMAEEEGLFLDPVYTGKAFAGLIQMAREGMFKPDENVLFLHSGGAGGLFAVK